MLTSYDQYTAALFDQAGVADPAGRRLGGQQRLRLRDDPLPVTVDELLLVRGGGQVHRRAFVIGDLPFGSYEDGPSFRRPPSGS